MILHHTKNKGDLGVLKAKCDLFKKSTTFRVETPKNNQTKGINFLEDYCEVP
jgi:hypothetical protein